jgi:CheY-like chemotaxis protein
MSEESRTDPVLNPRILIVEDNPIDVLLLKQALKASGFTGQPTVLDDGAPALRLLRGEEPFQDEQRPDMVILDLNLKTIDGPEVLAYIRDSEDLRKMLVVILSSSPEDVMRMKAAEADSYLTKPPGLAEFIAIGDKLRDLYTQKAVQSRGQAS